MYSFNTVVDHRWKTAHWLVSWHETADGCVLHDLSLARESAEVSKRFRCFAMIVFVLLEAIEFLDVWLHWLALLVVYRCAQFVLALIREEILSLVNTHMPWPCKSCFPWINNNAVLKSGLKLLWLIPTRFFIIVSIVYRLSHGFLCFSLFQNIIDFLFD